MIRLALPALLLVSACASAPATVSAPVEPSQAGWEAGQAAYLAWNAGRRGWATTDSGLQYRRVGAANPSGDRPGATDTVRVHYRGTFIDGRPFDSSYDAGEPIEFPLNRVIAGWTEGVQLMREGETFEFVIPAALAYGDRWIGGDLIPPNSVLIFQVELLEVNPGA